jgi:hypothetical protein
MQIWGNATEGYAWARGKKLILNLETLENFEHMTSNKIDFPKDASVKHCAGSHWMSYSWTKKQPEISPKIPLDPVSFKNNVVFKTTVKWMP